MSLPFNLAFSGISSGLQTKNAAASGGVGGWKELARTTLGSANASITVSSLPNKRYYMLLCNKVGASGSVYDYYLFGNGSVDTGSNYAYRYSQNGGADSTTTSTTDDWTGVPTSTTPTFHVGYIANYSTKEKLIQNWCCGQNTAGAGTAPVRAENASKWANTSNPLDIVSFTSLASTFNTGSEVVVLGWDPADTHTNNFWTELASTTISTTGDTFNTGTFTAKKYLWIQYYLTGTAPIRIFNRFGNGTVDTGNNYSARRNINGTSEDTVDTASGIAWIGANAAKSQFANLFVINNSANEKLVIGHLIDWATSGAGTAPNRKEIVGKWANTSAQANIFGIHNDDAGDITSGYIKVWGSN